MWGGAWTLLPILFVQPGSDSLLGQTPGVFKSVISSVLLFKRLADKTPWGLRAIHIKPS